MAESEDSFIVISPKNTGSIHSIDGWSEISVPSNRSNSITKKSAALSAFSVFTTLIPSINVIAATNSDKGYYLINPPTQPIISTKPTTNNITNHLNESISSVGSRVPFSWAEITKIQPTFHGDCNKSKAKVFDHTPKIRTRFQPSKKNKNTSSRLKAISQIEVSEDHKSNEDLMPCIPETKPCTTRVRKAGKRGSRLRYPNGRRGSRRNWRKKNHK